MELTEQQIKEYLERIANILMLNGGFMDSPGLYSGEMGVALFFFHYADFTQNEVYSEYGIVLLEGIQEKISQDTPVGYHHGLTGMGSTIEYLVQYGFIEADTDDILEDFDEWIFSIEKLSNLSFDDLLDVANYAYWRLSGDSNKKDIIYKTVLPQVVHLMESKNATHPAVIYYLEVISLDYYYASDNYSAISARRLFCCIHSPCYLKPDMYIRLLERFSQSESLASNNFELGVQDGLAGLGLYLITELDGEYGWVSLFPNALCTCTERIQV